MTKKVCKKLLNAKEKPIKSKKIIKQPGIYGIFEKEKENSRKSKLLYVGESNNPYRRKLEHMRGTKQAIDKKIARTSKKRLFIKNVRVNDPGRKEKKYMDCLKEMGERLPYNKTVGNSKRSHKRRKPRRKQN